MFKLVKKLQKLDYLYMFLILVFVVIQVWLDLTLPDYTSNLTSAVAGANLTMKTVWKNGGMMLLCAFGSMLSSFACGYVCAVLGARFSKIVRGDLYKKISSFSTIEMKKFSTPSLITRTTNDVEQIQNFVAMGLQVLIKAPILAVWAIAKISATSIEWTLATLITVVILISVVAIVVLFVLPKFKKIQKLIDNLNGSVRENITGVRVVRAYNAESFQEEKFEKANKELTDNHLFTSKLTGVLMPVMTLCMNGLTLAIYWIGAVLINRAEIPMRASVIGNMTSFTYCALQVVMAFIMMIAMFIILPRSIVSAKRINEVLDTKMSIQNGEYNEETLSMGEIEFKNVSFCYTDGKNDVVTNVNFAVQKGETIAIIGSTGAGKTSLINLIPRFYDCTSGEVLVDGKNVKDYNLETLQNKVAVVTQKACLFKGSIESNVAYGVGNEIDKQKLNQALDIACADFVKDLQDGVKAEVAQGGTNFSGGQKQRLSIARAIYKDAEIIIFDDSFSALDYKTDSLVRAKLKKNLNGKTIVIVAQRIGTIRDADKILVLDNGKVVGFDSHKNLLETCPVYKEIALSQLSKEEL